MHIMFVRAFLPHLDSRMNKYVRALKQKGNKVSFIGWPRGPATGTPPVTDDGMFLYDRPAALGGGWRNLFALAAWNLYVIRTLYRQRQKISAVHAVDLDSALAAYVFCRLWRKPLVFDIYDHYADTRSIGGPARAVFCAIERFIARHADLTLLADESRYRQHGLEHDAHIMVVENVPDSEVDAIALDPADPGPIRIGYLGVFEPRHRGLENLLEAFAGMPGIALHFGGYGPLNDRLKAASEQHENVYLHGPLTHEAGMSMLSNMHCTVGFYHLSVPNHRYAAPNKSYEHLLLGRPLLTTRDTPPGIRVEQEQSGWALEESVQALHAWRDGVSMQELAIRGRRARLLWDTRYKHYSANTLAGLYHDRLLAMTRRG